MLLKRKYLFGSTILAGVMAVTAPAFAQSQLPPVNVQGQADQDATEIDEVVVTGSRIRRDPTNAPTPLIQVNRETLLTTGQSTVIDYLATIPALSNSVVPSDTTGSGLGDGGLSLANLRSLGSNRTLTLVDGRRHVGSNGGSLAVDVDTIPRLLIENIEIITGGASSVYGADAVSGVLNFVLRKDFEGLEIDANYGMINQGGEASKRISALLGHNFFDDRLNLYAHAEYEQQDPVTSFDIDWIEDGYYLLGIDADPTNAALGPPADGFVDSFLFRGPVRMDRPVWGQTTIAHTTRLSPTGDPDVANFTGSSCNFTYAAGCYAVAPGYTYWYDGTTARPANFGQRIGETGVSRPYNYGGDGDNPAAFSTLSRVPDSESQRYQVGANLRVTDNIDAFFEVKHIIEDTFDVSQPTFFDFDLDNTSYAPTQLNSLWGVQAMDLRWDDNAFLPALVRNAIATNRLEVCTPPTATTPSTNCAPGPLVQLGRHSMFGPDRYQDNHRELTRFVVGARGSFDQLLFIDNINWDIGYTYGEATMENIEGGVDSLRVGLAADSVFDVAGVVNGTPGQIVCRAQLLDALGLPLEYNNIGNVFGGEDVRNLQGYSQADIDSCAPLNIFGDGNQSQAALDYIDAAIAVTELNEQEQFIASAAGELWDFWGAGPIGVALGVEYRREYTEAVGRDADTNGRFLFMNTGPDFVGAQYESEEVFAELSLPLFRDSWMGEYAELSGSYRYADYTTVGELDVYGVNLVYRPVQDITFKTSFNSSVRVPDLGENFSPFSQTFANGFVDPCATNQIAGIGDAEIRNNRITNCSALAAAQGLSFDFGSATATTTDDFLPAYTSGIAGVLGGNPFLQPEESESFTFSTVIQPRWFPNLSLVLDYYEIEIENVISTVSAQTAANNCVSGASLNTAACATIFRNRGQVGEEFWVGGPVGDPIGGFIEGSINYAALTTRGLDFTARYSVDIEETFGRNWGRLDYSIGGLWLIEQEQFLNSSDPNDGTEIGSTLFYPRVRFTSSLTYTPNDVWSVNWTVDWQTAQDIVSPRNFIANSDSRSPDYLDTGDFARHDFTVRWNVEDNLSLRAGVVNAFDNEQAPWLGTTLYSNFDPYGTRFFIGLNYRPW
ncbi:TonB-dependent receptor domain-containing protein [Brevundimonas sp.]|uniref:TonB-dependent receptor domain-containing protein n=1 Tax=Brevundimonas sp. TaxID=1871086 RepID=UPI002FC8ACF3